MKFIVVSDIHFEFTPVDYLKIEVSDPEDTTLILAGDINVGLKSLTNTLLSYTNEFANVVYVAGNHDYYGSSVPKLNAELKGLQDLVDNLYVLDMDIVVIEGVSIGGATLWGQSDEYVARMINDFDCIQELNITELHKEHLAWLKADASGLDILVTHFCPDPALGNPMFPSNELTDYFCPNVVDNLPKEFVMPTFWLFGHTHYSLEHKKKGTTFIANQVGYPRERQNLEIKEYHVRVAE
jgi:predicted phosphohydrolase